MHVAPYLLFMLATSVISDVVATDPTSLTIITSQKIVESDSKPTTQKISTLPVVSEPALTKSSVTNSNNRAKADIIDGYRTLKSVSRKELAKELTGNSQMHLEERDIKVNMAQPWRHLICKNKNKLCYHIAHFQVFPNSLPTTQIGPGRGKYT